MNIFHLIGAAIFALGFAADKKVGTKIDKDTKTVPELKPEPEITPGAPNQPEPEPEPNHDQTGDNPDHTD